MSWEITDYGGPSIYGMDGVDYGEGKYGRASYSEVEAASDTYTTETEPTNSWTEL